jgi:hypothetical protein
VQLRGTGPPSRISDLRLRGRHGLKIPEGHVRR